MAIDLNLNRSFLKISVVLLPLISNTVSFGMMTTIVNLPKVQHKKKKPSQEFKAHQAAGFKKFQGKCRADKEKQLLLKNEPENKFFDFSTLPEDLLYVVIRYLPSYNDMDSFALTSRENYDKIEVYKNNQKPLTKQYLCGKYSGNKDTYDSAKKLKQDNPNLPDFYGFILTAHTTEYGQKKIECGFIEDYQDSFWYDNELAIMRNQRKHMLMRKQYSARIFGYSVYWKIDPLMLACLQGGDYNNNDSIKCLKNAPYGLELKKELSKNERLFLNSALMIAINENNNYLSELFLDGINNVPFKKKPNVFYFDLLRTLKTIHNTNAFTLVVNKIPHSSIIIDLLDDTSNTFDESDATLFQLRKQQLEKESIERKQDGQHCVII